MKREKGFYWLLVSEYFDGEERWIVGEWYNFQEYQSRWYLPGADGIYDDKYFLEIDENRIIKTK